MKRTQPCHVCIDLLTIDKYFIFDEDSQPEFRLLQLTDRGGLKYPSEFILETTIVTLWKTLIAIESRQPDGDIDARIIQKDYAESEFHTLC